MKINPWNGEWPTSQYPPNGTLIRYKAKRSTEIKEAKVKYVWCGIEPAIVLDNGETIFPSFDMYEEVKI